MNKSRILTNFFNLLNKHNIPYCVLRNYENYPEEINGDVDLLIPKKFKDKLGKIFDEFKLNNNLKVWVNCFNNKTRLPVILFKFDKHKEINKIDLDIHFQFENFGVELINTNYVLGDRKPFKNFYILDKKIEFFHIILHGIFRSSNPKYNKRYKNKIKEFLEEGREIPRKHLKRIFPRIISSSIINNLENKNIKEIFKFNRIKKIIFVYKGGLLWQKVQSAITRKIKKVINIFSPPGELLVLLGPDGVGKSTTAIFTKELLNNIGLPAIHEHLGFRPAVLPSRGNLGINDYKTISVKNSLNEDKKNRKKGLSSLFSYFYHLIDYVLYYWLKIYPSRIKGKTFIAERYFYDYIFHPSRKKINISKNFVLWTFKFLVPKPTSCVLFTNDSKEILKRREELTEEEVKYFLKEAEKIGRKTSGRFKKIKTDLSPEEISIKLIKWLICEK